MDAAKGQYVAFLDADDEMANGCLSKLYRAAVEQDCDIAVGNYTKIYADGSNRGKAYCYEDAYSVWEREEALLRSLKDDPATYTVWGKLYRKDILENIRFTEGRKIHEDSFFLFELFRNSPKVVVIDDIVIRYHITEGSASRAGFSEKYLDILYFAKKKHEIITKEYPQYQSLAGNVLVKAGLALLNVMKSNNDPRYLEVEKECIHLVHTNAASFVPAIRRDKVLFQIVRLRLYGAYKAAWRICSRRN